MLLYTRQRHASGAARYARATVNNQMCIYVFSLAYQREQSVRCQRHAPDVMIHSASKPSTLHINTRFAVYSPRILYADQEIKVLGRARLYDAHVCVTLLHCRDRVYRDVRRELMKTMLEDERKKRRELDEENKKLNDENNDHVYNLFNGQIRCCRERWHVR